MNEEVFVTRQLDQFESITQALEARGFHYTYPILNQSVIEANKLISEQLQIPIATRIFSYRKLRIVHASEEEARLLHVAEDAEILMSTGLTYLDSVKPFEYFQIVAIPSFFKFRSVTTV